jgi:hypothetical protein
VAALRQITLTRIPEESGDDGAFGKISTGTFECYSGEPPEILIPPGKYRVTWRMSNRLKIMVYHIENVPGHEGMLFHSGNFCGDVTRGKKSDSEGCVLLGRAIGALAGQKALLSSKDARLAFEADMEQKDFDLIVQ